VTYLDVVSEVITAEAGLCVCGRDSSSFCLFLLHYRACLPMRSSNRDWSSNFF